MSYLLSVPIGCSRGTPVTLPPLDAEVPEKNDGAPDTPLLERIKGSWRTSCLENGPSERVRSEARELHFEKRTATETRIEYGAPGCGGPVRRSIRIEFEITSVSAIETPTDEIVIEMVNRSPREYDVIRQSVSFALNGDRLSRRYLAMAFREEGQEVQVPKGDLDETPPLSYSRKVSAR